ncbi:MAG: hypothetical protein K5896_09080 [Prevotella sp.]|nr:hypothetical protein [Prevotella sp.]
MINYESPLFVDIVLYTIYALLTVAVLLTVWSVVRPHVRGERCEVRGENGVPVRRIALLTGGLLVVTMVVTWLTASTEPLSINGKTYADAFWLRASDMLINTTLVLIAVVAAAIIFSVIKAQKTNLKSE